MALILYKNINKINNYQILLDSRVVPPLILSKSFFLILSVFADWLFAPCPWFFLFVCLL
jgi:hypothetical protein